MSAKFALFFLLGFYFQTTVFTLIITQEQVRAWKNYTKNLYYDDCKHHMSEETQLLYEDDDETDNEETRKYNLCVTQHHGYLKSGKIDIDKIAEDGLKFVTDVPPPIVMGGKVILKICKTEAEVSDDELEILAKFYYCLHDRVQTDL